MLHAINLTERSLERLHRRNVSDAEIIDFQQLLNDARAEMADTGKSSKQVLMAMDSTELSLLQRANSLAQNINANELSEEGATNLLKQPDFSDRVDINNDGIVEVGIARTLVFPPVNAPPFVKQAWNKASEGMQETDLMTLQLHMHLVVFGVQIEGIPTKTPLAPEQQWSADGIQTLLSDLYGALEFAVNMDGWTDTHKMEKEVYSRFEQALENTSPSGSFYRTTQSNQQATEKHVSTENIDKQTSYETLMQLVLDARIGLDRTKLKEIDEKIQALESDTSLDPATKKDMLQQLEKQKQNVLDEAQKRIEHEQKLRALQQQLMQ
ncbi:hypothetical protein RS130_09500 [Paraglaciecola aquimarina]|uniref:Uncharacterized protein n=1 Tax=Paraglaciecola aquimarina TaxID=1235557 RepID=A0ABU3SVU2_9ALTE|nr:hypothetical protein [Paraglaciecola aquimarina]MDU0354142.1 hypothetical protein [Paraglaciecola aquimarina]